MLGILDTHAHLCDRAFDADLEPVLERARAAGVTGVVAVGETLDDACRNLELSGLHPEIHPAIKDVKDTSGGALIVVGLGQLCLGLIMIAVTLGYLPLGAAP